MTERTRILVIKLGALGDFMYALGAMRSIRDYHKDAHITLLTQKPFADLARKTGFFDEILLDPKPKYNPIAWLSFKKFLNEKNFTRVYDLQNNDRTENYFRLLSPKPEWSGIAKGASHRNTDPLRRKFHAFLGHRNTLQLAGIETVELDPLDWMTSDTSRFNLVAPYALLVIGSAPSRPNKRWPLDNFRKLAEKLIDENIQPVILGSDSEIELATNLAKGLQVINLAGQTKLDDIPALARDASIAVGNDTGPMHMIAMTGCPSVFFFRRDESTIEKHGPPCVNAKSFEANSLKSIQVDDVMKEIRKIWR